MNYSDYRFTLDIQIHQAQVSVPVTFGDSARRLCIGLTDGRKSYVIGEGCRAVFNAKKPDGNVIKNDCIIERNVILYEFTEQTANCEGIVYCDITLYGTDGKVLTSPQFIIVVDKRVVRDAELIANLSESESTTLDNIIASEQTRQLQEQMRQEGENYRGSQYIAAEAERDRMYGVAEGARDDAFAEAEKEREKYSKELVEYGSNLINPSRIIEHMRFGSGNNQYSLTEGDEHYVTDLIPVQAGHTYYFYHNGSSKYACGALIYCFYDGSMNGVQRVNRIGSNDREITAPDTAKFIRLENNKYNKPIGLYETDPLEFVPFYKRLAKDVGLDNHIDDITKAIVHTRTETSKNLYDRNGGISDVRIASTGYDGTPQQTEPYEGWKTQKIEISNANSYSLYGVRLYSLTDENDIVKQRQKTITEDAPYVLSNIPDGTKYLWVSVKNQYRNVAQVEVGTELSTYEPYKETRVVEVGGNEVVTECPLDEQDVTVSKYTSDTLLRETEQLKRELEFMKQRQSGLYNVRSGATVNSQVVPLKDTREQKLILHVHRYENNGYDTTNDVFLPNAKKDFNDLRITDNKGNILPYFINRICDVDFVEDSRLTTQEAEEIFKDSNGNLIAHKHRLGICVSDNNGETWTPIAAFKDFGVPSIMAINPDDSLLIGDCAIGKAYKYPAPYTTGEMVLDFSQYTEVSFDSYRTNRLKDGSLVTGGYQKENSIRIYKSTNNGSTWTKVYEDNSGKYQHVHKIHVDNSQSVETIYVGCDGGGGVLKSTDGGASWVDLRELYPDMPQATDFGVIYSEKGFRLLGGETGIVRGHSIIRTEDDVTFTPVASVGNGVYYAKRIGGYIVAGLVSQSFYRTAGILMSKDNGLTWDKVYTTSIMSDSAGASDAFRFLDDSLFDNTVIAYCQSASRKALRITAHQEPIYAEIFVDVPEGTTSVTVENGYAVGNTLFKCHEYEPEKKKLLYYPLNEGSGFVREAISGNIYKGDFVFTANGKSFSRDTNDKSVLLSSLNGFKNNITLGNKFTISFWISRSEEARFDLICKGANRLRMLNYALYFNNIHVVSPLHPVIAGMQRIDIVFDGENKTVKCYFNGAFNRAQYETVNVDDIINAFIGDGDMLVLQNKTCTGNDCIQHFTIYDGALTEQEMMDSYYLKFSDNHQKN